MMTRTFCKIQSFTNTNLRIYSAYCVLLVHHSVPAKTVTEDIYENNLHINTLLLRSVFDLLLTLVQPF